ncbi:hypothetical protein BSAF29S_04504 [Bacillus safensis subsp. safensis]
MHTSISRLRQAGFIEGMSLLTLLLIAMPLKYFADIPMAVTICRLSSWRIVCHLYARFGICDF